MKKLSAIFMLFVFCTVLVGTIHGSVGPPIKQNNEVSISLPNSFMLVETSNLGPVSSDCDYVYSTTIEQVSGQVYLVRNRGAIVARNGASLPAVAISYLTNGYNSYRFNTANTNLNSTGHKQRIVIHAFG